VNLPARQLRGLVHWTGAREQTQNKVSPFHLQQLQWMQKRWSPVCFSTGWHQKRNSAYKTSHQNPLFQGCKQLIEIRMPFLLLNQQCQSIEGKVEYNVILYIWQKNINYCYT